MSRNKMKAIVAAAVVFVVAAAACLWFLWEHDFLTSDDGVIPTIPEEQISNPSEGEGQDGDSPYDSGEWHSDKGLRGSSGLKEVTLPNGVTYAAGEVIVYFDGNASDETVKSVADSLRANDYEIDYLDGFNEAMVVLFFADNADCEKLAEKAAKLPGVKSANPNYTGTALDGTVSPNDKLCDKQNYLEISGFKKAWSIQRSGAEVKIAVLDSGIDFDHEDLSSAIDREAAYDAIEKRRLTSTTDDSFGHGTIVSGIAAAQTGNGKGIAGCSYNATIIPVRVINDKGTYCTSDLNEALDYLAIMGNEPRVVNMSLGGLGRDSSLQEKINTLSVSHNVTCVASVGNDSASTSGAQKDALRYPAACDNVIGVGAVDSSLRRCDFSNVNSSIDICALGSRVYATTNPDASLSRNHLYDDRCKGENGVERTLDGTSFSAPQVSAAAALLAAQHPGWGPMQIEERLKLSAADLGSSNRDDEYGYGLLDTASAVGWKSGAGSGTSGSTSPSTGGSAIDMILSARR